MDIDKYIKLSEQINDCLKKELTAHEIDDEANDWLLLTVFLAAYDVAKLETKSDRAARLESIKNNQPIFYDDVSELAPVIYKHIMGNKQ